MALGMESDIFYLLCDLDPVVQSLWASDFSSVKKKEIIVVILQKSRHETLSMVFVTECMLNNFFLFILCPWKDWKFSHSSLRRDHICLSNWRHGLHDQRNLSSKSNSAIYCLCVFAKITQNFYALVFSAPWDSNNIMLDM